MAFKPATKKAAYLRLAVLGPAGSGKSFTLLRLAQELAQGGKIAAIDTERGSLSKYAGEYSPDGGAPFEFDVDDSWTEFKVQNYIQAIQDAERAGYAVLVIDSLSHAWAGPGGLLEFVDAKKGASANNFAAWRDATPLHNKLVDTILSARLHVLVSMRTKMEYVLEDQTDSRGRTTKVPRKVGMAPIQREGLEYEFDVIGDMAEGTMTISKTRCPALTDKRIYHPGAETARTLLAWLGRVERAPAPEPSQPTTPASAPDIDDAVVAALIAAARDAGHELDPVGAMTALVAFRNQRGKTPTLVTVKYWADNNQVTALLGAAGVL